MKTTRNRVSEKEVISHVVVCVPTTRLLAVGVDVFAIEDGTIQNETFTSPVVSIRTTVVDLWLRREPGGEPDPREYADAGELREARYQFCRQQLDDEMLVLSPSGESLISLDDLRREWYAAVHVIAATWESCEDEQRLTPIVADAVAKATAAMQQEAQQPIAGRMAS